MPIRQYRPETEEFVEEFLDTIIPSAIPNERFIDWQEINREIENYERQIAAISDLEGATREEFIEGIANALLTAEDTREWIDFYFELVGERGNKYSCLEGVYKFYPIQRAIDSGDYDEARELGRILYEIGLQRIVDEGNVRDHYRGMLVGMESHSRKNRQGSCFEAEVEERVANVADALREEGFDAGYDDEYVTEYQDDSGQSKRVDFSVFLDGELKIAVETNCYKVQGSKPSEIRRSYNYVAQRMREDGVIFVWITDGQGWESMENMLGESYDDITDIYNLHQADEHLVEDILAEFHD